MTLKLKTGKSRYLKEKSEVVTDFKKATLLAKKMFVLLNKYPSGAGIAANQVGFLLQLFIMNHKGMKKVVINPTITKKSFGKMYGIEGCLSYPGIFKTVKRCKEITVKYFNGKVIIEEKLTGMNARIFQHEFDHLNGICKVGKGVKLS